MFAQSQKGSTAIYYHAIKDIKDFGTLTRAFDFFERKSQKTLKAKDSIRAAYYLELIALGQFEIGFYYESEATTIEALNILKPLDRLVFLSIYLKSKHKKNKLQVGYNTESLISKKLHDKLANDMYQVMTKLEADQVKANIMDVLEDIYLKTRDISKSISQLETSTNFLGQLKDLLLTYNNHNTSVITKGLYDIHWNKTSQLKKNIFRVLQKRLTNMKKHSNASHAIVTFKMVLHKIHKEYRDNGTGCELTKKGDLANAENRIEMVKGKITFESMPNKGFYVKISV